MIKVEGSQSFRLRVVDYHLAWLDRFCQFWERTDIVDRHDRYHCRQTSQKKFCKSAETDEWTVT